MRLLNNKNNYDFSKDVCNLEYKIKSQDIKSAAIWLLPTLIPIIAFILLMGLSTWILGAFLSIIYLVPITSIIMLNLGLRYIKYRSSSKKIKQILKENNNKLDVTKEDLELCDVLEIENEKDKVTLKNGKKAKRKRVTDYIVISQNKKLKIIKQMTKQIKNKFYKKVERKIELLNDNDLVNEGLITTEGKLTEKGKLLNLKLN